MADLNNDGRMVLTVASTNSTATQSGISVTPSAVVGSFIVTGFPATMAGGAQQFTGAVKDVFGKLTTSCAGTVTFSSSDAQAGLPASSAFAAADAGVHTFTATLKMAGTQSITVKDAANAAAVGSQTGIAVSGSAVIASLSVAALNTVSAVSPPLVIKRPVPGRASAAHVAAVFREGATAASSAHGRWRRRRRFTAR